VLTNVVATLREDSVGIDFDPVDGAVDYRVYLLPDMSDVTVNSDSSLTIKNATYRCAGLRQTYDLPNGVNIDTSQGGCLGSGYTGPLAFGPNTNCPWTASIPSNPTLGYVYVEAGAGRVPVYAVGVHPTAPEVGWRETRPKIYTTDATLRQTLLGQGGRDDGIVFYVPAAAGSDTQTVYHSTENVSQGVVAEHYFGSGDVASRAMDATPPAPAFQVLAASAQGTEPLMAVFYEPGQNHTELAVGKERFNRAANQGDTPLWHLEWSGLTQPTTLVVEALSSGCPYPGVLSAQTLNVSNHDPFLTLAQMQQSSATGEVFINGMYDTPGRGNGSPAYLQTPTASPIPVARSYIQVAPQPHNPSDWDWYEGFSPGSDFGSVTSVPGCTEGGMPGENCGHWVSSKFDISGYRFDESDNHYVFTYGNVLGQLWTIFDDVGADTTGKLRFTPLQKANIDSDPNTFLHVTWSVNALGTDRRYPQLFVSDQSAPVQSALANADTNTLLLQTIQGPSMRFELQAFHGLVNGKEWDVNNQAPFHALVDVDNWNANPSTKTIPPAEPLFEHTGLDRMTKFDAYISSGRTYLFVDGTPAGCTQYPSGFSLTGSVTVTFGDVLYHEGAEVICEQTRPFAFMHGHECLETVRHWDDIGFKSGVPAPTWDDGKFPCEAY
jgi:hypothetical protein